MNKVKGVVRRVLDISQSKNNDAWFVRVEYNSYGNSAIQTLIFDTKEKAESVEKGYEF